MSAMSLMAADNPMIQVTTFEDQNGEDLSKCSLREALDLTTIIVLLTITVKDCGLQ